MEAIWAAGFWLNFPLMTAHFGHLFTAIEFQSKVKANTASWDNLKVIWGQLVATTK